VAHLSTRRLSCGFLAHSEDVDVREEDGLVCLARGDCRFDDPSLSDLAASSGAAAAWLSAFQRHRDRAPLLAHGRFAVVVVESAARSVTIATDRFATWPVCFSLIGDSLIFADRADALTTAPQLSAQSLFDYLFFHMIPAPATIFAQIERVPPAHLLLFHRGELECHPYWVARFHERARPSLEQSREQFLGIVERAVAREAAGHHAGAYLSGGTDSSTVAGMLGKVQGRPAKTYSIGFDAAGYDEMAYARIAARHFSTDHHEYYVSPADLLEGIPRIASHYEQPFGNSSALPALICAERAKQDGIDKMLAGDGGDELFGGNSRYATQRVFGWYGDIPSVLRSRVIERLLSTPTPTRIPVLKKAVSYVKQARVPMPDRLQSYNQVLRIGVAEIFEEGFLAAVDADEPLAAQRQFWASLEAESLINRMLAFDWRYTLADNDLPKVLGTTQMAGIDVGFPLLADELLEFSLDLPPEWKLKGLTLRWFFKEALRGFLPIEIIQKKKHGFGLPFGLWTTQNTALHALASDSLSALGERRVIRRQFLKALLDTRLNEHPSYYGEMVWILMMLELWIQNHAPSWRFDG
jgi:asparagine synthase (glutamine-hydrolysing)